MSKTVHGTNVSAERLRAFMAAYETALRKNIAEHPERYGYGLDRVPSILDQIEKFFARGAAQGRGWPLMTDSVIAACQSLRIGRASRPTFKALGAYLRGEP